MSEQLQQLQAELDSVKSKLAKTEASKQKLKESWVSIVDCATYTRGRDMYLSDCYRKFVHERILSLTPRHA